MREKWTDERLDDLNHRVDLGFERTERNLTTFRTEVDARFDRVDARFDRVDARFDRVDARFDSLQRTMLHGVIALSGAMLAGFGGIIALVASQL